MVKLTVFIQHLAREKDENKKKDVTISNSPVNIYTGHYRIQAWNINIEQSFQFLKTK
jgi:hypothetical protein